MLQQNFHGEKERGERERGEREREERERGKDFSLSNVRLRILQQQFIEYSLMKSTAKVFHQKVKVLYSPTNSGAKVLRNIQIQPIFKSGEKCSWSKFAGEVRLCHLTTALNTRRRTQGLLRGRIFTTATANYSLANSSNSYYSIVLICHRINCLPGAQLICLERL